MHSSPAIGSDGTVYVGSKDHKLYAIKPDSKGLAKSLWPMRGQNAGHTGRMKKRKKKDTPTSVSSDFEGEIEKSGGLFKWGMASLAVVVISLIIAVVAEVGDVGRHQRKSRRRPRGFLTRATQIMSQLRRRFVKLPKSPEATSPRWTWRR